MYATALIGHRSGPENWDLLGMNASGNDNGDTPIV